MKNIANRKVSPWFYAIPLRERKDLINELFRLARSSDKDIFHEFLAVIDNEYHDYKEEDLKWIRKSMEDKEK